MPEQRSLAGAERPRPHVVAIVGPTAAGKTLVAEHVALALGGHVVTADSMQVYRGMDIGTAKPRVGARRVVHHCIDLVEPGEPFSAAAYQPLARAAIESVARAGGVPVVAGGTGLYVRAALDDMRFPSGDAASPTRRRLEELADGIGAQALHAMLAERDAASAALIHPHNVRRTVRALEMLEEQGVSYADQTRAFRERVPYYPTRYVGLTLDREVLYRRIDERVDAMMGEGLLGEVQRLLDAGFVDALTAPQAIGYKELVPVLTDGAPLGEAVDSIKRATRRYAKRQLTWFGADPRVTWVDVGDMSPTALANALLDLLASDAPWEGRDKEGAGP